MNPIARALAVTAAVASIAPAMTAVAWPGGQALAAANTTSPAAGRITTVAGGIGGPGPGRAVAAVPCDVVFTGGHVLFGDNNGYLRQLDPRTGRLTTPAGGGTAGAGALAADAALSVPCGLAVYKPGDVAVTELNQVQVIAARTGSLFGQAMSGGHIYTLSSFSSDIFVRVAFDHDGNLLVTDPLGNQVGVIAVRSGTFYGQVMTAGSRYVIAGTGQAGFAGDGGPATAALLNVPAGVVVDVAGNVAMADYSNNRVRMVAESSGTFFGIAMTAGDIYTIAGQHFGGYYGDGGPATRAELCSPMGLTLDRVGNLLITDTCDNRIRVVADRAGRFYGRAMKAGFIYSVAGGPAGRDGGLAGAAGLLFPSGVAVDGAGNVVIADWQNNRLRVVAEQSGHRYGRPMITGRIYDVAGNGQQSASGNGGPALSGELDGVHAVSDGPLGALFTGSAVRLLAAKSGDYFGQKMTRGDLYAIAGGGSGALKNGGPGMSAVSGAEVAADDHGNALIADATTSKVWVVAAQAGTFYGERMKAGRIYSIAGTGTQGNSGIGGEAAKAELQDLEGVAADRFGDVVIAENALATGGSYAHVLLVAASTGRFYGVAMRAGHIYQVAGAQFAGNGPSGWVALNAKIGVTSVSTDQAGNLLLGEDGNDKVRVIPRVSGTYYDLAMTAGREYVVAGDGTGGFAGDGGPATAAELAVPEAAAADAAGNLLVCDSGNNRIRVVAARNGMFYGVPMTKGDIYTIAGNGTAGFAGDNGPAIQAELNFPTGITATSAGALIVDNSRLRLITG